MAEYGAYVDQGVHGTESSYIETKGHNWLMAKFAQMKMAATGTVLTLLGYSSEELSIIAGKHSQEIPKLLSNANGAVAMHRDDLVVTD